MGPIAKLPDKVLVPAVSLLPRVRLFQICLSRRNDDIAKLGQVWPLELGINSSMTLHKFLGEVESVTVYCAGLAHFHLLVVCIAHSLVLLGKVTSKRSRVIKGHTTVLAIVLWLSPTCGFSALRSCFWGLSCRIFPSRSCFTCRGLRQRSSLRQNSLLEVRGAYLDLGYWVYCLPNFSRLCRRHLLRFFIIGWSRIAKLGFWCFLTLTNINFNFRFDSVLSFWFHAVNSRLVILLRLSVVYHRLGIVPLAEHLSLSSFYLGLFSIGFECRKIDSKLNRRAISWLRLL